MPMREVSFAHVGAGLYSIASIPGDTGILVGACLSQAVGCFPAVVTGPAQFYGAIYLSSIDTRVPVPAILLAQGRLGTYTAISWTGRIIRDSGQILIAHIAGAVNCTFTIRALTEP